MSALTVDVAEAVLAELNKDPSPWSLEFTAARCWVADYTLAQLETLRVAVLHGPMTWSAAGRTREAERRSVDVAILQRVDPKLTSQVDPLIALLEEIVAHFLNKTLTAGTRTIQCEERRPVSPEDAPLNPEILGDFRTFKAVLRLTFRVLGAP